MELLENLTLGLSVALTLQNLMYCFLGVFLGTMIGVLPGIGPLATMAMLLPLTFILPPVSAWTSLPKCSGSSCSARRSGRTGGSGAHAARNCKRGSRSAPAPC